jgi:hypothetical protein
VHVSGGLPLSCGTATVMVVTTPLLGETLLDKRIPGFLVRFSVRIDQELGAGQSLKKVVSVIPPASTVRTGIWVISIESVRERNLGIGSRTGNVRLVTSSETCRARIGEAGFRWNGLRWSELDYLRQMLRLD